MGRRWCFAVTALIVSNIQNGTAKVATNIDVKSSNIDVKSEDVKMPLNDEMFKSFVPDEKSLKDDEDIIVEATPDDDLSEDQMAAIKRDTEPFEFQAEVHRLMDIIINSLYTHKEVFLRELISNAADALEKIRFLSVEDPSVLGNLKELKITVEYDKNAKTLSIIDTGIGMTKQDLINNLGTVAKSGTSNFLEALAKGGDVNLIGQFGVGFYSAFLVADKVTVTSKHNDDDQHIWTSTADASFSVVRDPRGNRLGRGTRITLHIKDDSLELLEKSVLSKYLQRYSQFVNYPLYLRYSVVETVEEPVEDDSDKDDDVSVKEDADEKTKKSQKTVLKLTQLNQEKPIWMRPKEELTEDDYNKFYKSLTHNDDSENPLAHIHFTAEGEVEFKSILYVPARQSSDPYAGFFGKKQNIKLYVRRVLVAEQFEDLVPTWLTFIRGIVDSDDLPLKVDREAVSQNKVMKVIATRVVRKTLDVLRTFATGADKAEAELARLKSEEATGDKTDETRKELIDAATKSVSKYVTFYEEFGKNLKLGCIEDTSNRNKISKLLWFFTSKSVDKPVSLQSVVSRLPGNSTNIYYITAETKERAMASPHIDGLLKKGHEVLLLVDAVDEPCLSSIGHYDGKRLVSAEREETPIDQTEDEKTYHQKLKTHYKELLDWWKDYATNSTKLDAYGSRISKVMLSSRLGDAPAAVSSRQYGSTAFAEKVTRYQTFASPTHMAFARAGKTLEVNPQHPLIRAVFELYKKDSSSQELKDSVDYILDAALIASGFVDNPSTISKRLYKAVSERLRVDAESDLPPVDVSYIPDEVKEKPTDNTKDAADSEENLDFGNEDENMETVTGASASLDASATDAPVLGGDEL